MRSKLIEANRISFDRIQPYKKKKDKQKRTSRIVAADKLRAGGSSIRRIASATRASKSVVAKIKKKLDSGSESGLQAILDAENYRTGRKCVLTAEEEKMIVERFIFAAQRGFAVDREGVLIRHVSCGGRWQKNIQTWGLAMVQFEISDAVIRNLLFAITKNRQCEIKGEKTTIM